MRLNPAEYVIHKFGGVRATARALKKTPSTISKWQHQNEGKIPSANMLRILMMAEELNLDITSEDLIHGREISKAEFTE